MDGSFFGNRLMLGAAGLLVAAVITTHAAPAPAIEDVAIFPLHHDDSVYAPNVIRRFDPVTGEQMVTATVETSEGASVQGPLEHLIDGSHSTHASWTSRSPLTVQVTLDLGVVYRLGRVEVAWAGLQGKPKQFLLMVSSNGTDFTPVENVDDPRIQAILDRSVNLAGSRTAVWVIKPNDVRYLRLAMEGQGDAPAYRIGITDVRAYVDQSAPPPTSDEGYNLLDLKNASFQSLTRDSRTNKDQWTLFHPLRENAYFSHGIFGSPEATADAMALLDLGDAYPVFYLRLIMGNHVHLASREWEHGGKVEISRDGESWESLLDTREPLGGDLVFNRKGAEPIRFVRITNYHAEGKGTGTGRLYRLEAFGGRSNPVTARAFRIGQVQAPAVGTISAGIYDASGQLIRTLLKASPVGQGPRDLYWDRRTDAGELVDRNSVYTWKALTSQVEADDTGAVGQGAEPPQGDFVYDSRIADLFHDTNDDLYRVAYWDERHRELRRLTSDGDVVWGTGLQGGQAVAVDDHYVYAADSFVRSKQNQIHRFNKADGKPAPFAGGSHIFPVDEEKSTGGLSGLAVDDRWLFVSQSRDDKVIVFDKNTGEERTSWPMLNPRGIVVQRQDSAEASGVLWVIHSDEDDAENMGSSRLSAFRYDEHLTLKPLSSIPVLDRAARCAIGGPGKHLYVTEKGGMREYRIDDPAQPVPAGLKQFGRPHVPGPVTDDMFIRAQGIAVDSQGRFSISDPIMYRIQRFHPDGRLWQTLFAEFQPAPTVFADPTPGRHRMLSGWFEYEVDVSGSTHSDWLGDGTWRLANVWYPEDGRFATLGRGVQFSTRRSLPHPDGTRRDFIIYWVGDRAVFYEIGPEGRGMRRSVMVGGDWRGPEGTWPVPRPESKIERTPETGWKGRFIWTDLNGNGEIDGWGNGLGPLEDELKVFWKNRYPAFSERSPGRWIDEKGNLWFAHIHPTDGKDAGFAGKLPLLGFDEQGNPRYDWDTLEIVLPVGENPWQFRPANLRTTSNGDIYVIGNSPMGGPHSGSLWTGGNAVACYSADGERKFMVGWFGGNASVMTPDPDGDSGFWYTGHVGGAPATGSGQYVTMYTRDGLVAAIMRPGEKNDYYAAWMDHGWALDAYIQPETGDRFLYAECVIFGKSLRYRIRNTESLRMHHGEVD